jgi:hypothetical protein
MLVSDSPASDGKDEEDMSGPPRNLRTIVVAVVTAAVTGLTIPAVGGLIDGARPDKAGGGLVARSSNGPGRSVINGPGCDPATTTYVSCGSVQLNLARRGRVFLTMDGAWATSTAPSLGRCRFFGPGTSNQQADFGEPTDSETDHFFGFTEVTKRVDPGTRTFGLQCREFAGDTISFKEIMLSAVYVGNS